VLVAVAGGGVPVAVVVTVAGGGVPVVVGVSVGVFVAVGVSVGVLVAVGVAVTCCRTAAFAIGAAVRLSARNVLTRIGMNVTKTRFKAFLLSRRCSAGDALPYAVHPYQEHNNFRKVMGKNGENFVI
jgi:hypothetical protein